MCVLLRTEEKSSGERKKRAEHNTFVIIDSLWPAYTHRKQPKIKLKWNRKKAEYQRSNEWMKEIKRPSTGYLYSKMSHIFTFFSLSLFISIPFICVVDTFIGSSLIFHTRSLHTAALELSFWVLRFPKKGFRTWRKWQCRCRCVCVWPTTITPANLMIAKKIGSKKSNSKRRPNERKKDRRAERKERRRIKLWFWQAIISARNDYYYCFNFP